MSWIQKLYETYEQTGRLLTRDQTQPWPLAHYSKRAHVEVIIDDLGNFRRVKKLGAKESVTLIPVTEASVGRAGSKIAPHPLCEEVSYCARDFPERDEKNKRPTSPIWNTGANRRKAIRKPRRYLPT